MAGIKSIMVGGAILCGITIATTAILGPLVIDGCFPRAEAVRVLSHAKQVHLALIEFDKDYGRFPDTETAAAVKARTHTDLRLGSASSNDFMRQLLAAEQGNEKIFYAPFDGSRKPDDSWEKARASEKGECGFAYIPGYSSSSNSNYPLLISPLIRGTDRVDAKALHGQVVVMTISGGATTGTVDGEGHVTVFGKRLLDPGNPIWEGRTPIIAWPE
jgi:hypothetical protein